MPSSSNFPPSLGSEPGLIAQSYRAFSSPPLWPTYTIAPAGAVATSQGGPPARQHQGPEGVIRNVIASIIRAIAIMTNAVETSRIFGLSAKLVCGHLLVFRIVMESFSSQFVLRVRIRHDDDTGSIGTKNSCIELHRQKFRRSSAAVATSREGHHLPISGPEVRHRQ